MSMYSNVCLGVAFLILDLLYVAYFDVRLNSKRIWPDLVYSFCFHLQMVYMLPMERG